MANLNVTQGRLSRANNTTCSMKLWLSPDSGNDVARCLCDHINEIYSQWALKNGKYFCPLCVNPK